MKLSEMIALIGDENITVQNLFESSSGIDWKRRNGCVFKFHTNEVDQSEILDGKFSRTGLVIWFDLELYKQKLKEASR